MNKFKKIKQEYGFREMVFVGFYPIFLPIFMFRDTLLSVYNIVRALLNGNWKYLTDLNSLFYYIQSFNIKKFGRYGVSNLLSGGCYDLSSLFHLTPLSLSLQSILGTTFIRFFAMIFWLMSWFLLFPYNVTLWTVLGLTFFSTLFFTNFIVTQNYNVLGWMFFPLFLFSLEIGNTFYVGLLFFFISLCSLTASFFGVIIILIYFLFSFDIYLLVSTIPGIVRSLFPILKGKRHQDILKLIGVSNLGVKYKRELTNIFSIPQLYILGLQTQFVFFFIFYYGIEHLSIVLCIAIIFFWINELAVRFADQTSFYSLYLSCSVFVLLTVKDVNWWLYLSYFFSVYPISGLIMEMSRVDGHFVNPGERKVFDCYQTIKGLKDFFSSLPMGSKVLVAYKNPNKKYNNLFNGYRVFNEPMQYAAASCDLCLFPDWYFISNNNKEKDLEDFWIASEKEAISYMKKKNINYLLIPSFNNFSISRLKHINKFNFPLQGSRCTSVAKFQEYKLELYEYIV